MFDPKGEKSMEHASKLLTLHALWHFSMSAWPFHTRTHTSSAWWGGVLDSPRCRHAVGVVQGTGEWHRQDARFRQEASRMEAEADHHTHGEEQVPAPDVLYQYFSELIRIATSDAEIAKAGTLC